MKWVDTEKVDETRPNYRSRLVCREVKKAKRPGEQLKASQLFSSMPSLEAIKTLCSLCMSLGVSPKGKPLKLSLPCAELISTETLSVTCTWSCRRKTSSTRPTLSRCAVFYLDACTARRMLRRCGRRTTPNCWVANSGDREPPTEPCSTRPPHKPEQSCTETAFYCSAITTT
eukprot:6490890-Amphidinium_carterae.2